MKHSIDMTWTNLYTTSNLYTRHPVIYTRDMKQSIQKTRNLYTIRYGQSKTIIHKTSGGAKFLPCTPSLLRLHPAKEREQGWKKGNNPQQGCRKFSVPYAWFWRWVSERVLKHAPAGRPILPCLPKVLQPVMYFTLISPYVRVESWCTVALKVTLDISRGI